MKEINKLESSFGIPLCGLSLYIMLIEFHKITYFNQKFYIQKNKNNDFEFEALGRLKVDCENIYKIFLSVFLENDKYNPFTSFRIKKNKFTYNKLMSHATDLGVEKIRTKKQISKTFKNITLCNELQSFDNIVKEIITEYIGFDSFDFFIGFFYGYDIVHMIFTNIYDYYKLLCLFHKEELSNKIEVFKCKNEEINHYKKKNKFIEYNIGTDGTISMKLKPHKITKYILDRNVYHLAIVTYYKGTNLYCYKTMSVGSFSYEEFLKLVCTCVYSKGCVVVTGIRIFGIKFVNISDFMKEAYGFTKNVFFSEFVGVVKKLFDQEVVMITNKKKKKTNVFMITNIVNFYRYANPIT